MRFASSVLVLSIVGCSSSPDLAGQHCDGATLDARGGALVAPDGATLVVPPGALTAATDVSLCHLFGLAARRDQRSDVVVVRPVGLVLAAPATLTLPVQAQTLENARVELGQSVDDAAPVTLDDVRVGAATVGFDHDRFGYLRVFGDVTVESDAGMRDAPFVRIDSGPAPLAPVVVGIDLDPASYGCLAMRSQSAPGALTEVTLRVLDWQQGATRVGYQLRATTQPPDDALDCFATPECVFGQSGEGGLVTLTVPAGPTWIDVLQIDPLIGASDDRRFPVRHVHLPIDVPAAGGTVDVHAVSQRTFQSAGGGLTRFGELTMGRVVDCDGRPVQRARVRAFDAAGREVADFSGIGALYSYGTTGNVPAGGGDRTGPDGTYLVDNQSGMTADRIEAWGQLVAGGPEVMLACEHRGVDRSTMVVGELVPARQDRDTDCSE